MVWYDQALHGAKALIYDIMLVALEREHRIGIRCEHDAHRYTMMCSDLLRRHIELHIAYDITRQYV